MLPRCAVLVLALCLSLSAEAPYASGLARAAGLRAAGQVQQARDLYRSVLPDIRRQNDRASLARVLGELAAIQTSLGEYDAAIAAGREAAAICRQTGDARCEFDALNSAGLSHLYRAEYAPASENFRAALAIVRRLSDREQEIYLLNNIGNVLHYQAHYLEALRAYREAREIAGAGSESWRAAALRFTDLNLASLYLRLGQNEAALAIYQSLKAQMDALKPAEQAYLQANLGVLYRRLGDPYKALEAYGEALRIFTRQKRLEGQVGALRNMGITLAIELRDYPAALGRFSAALALAETSGNLRDAMQVRLYRGEVFYRLRRDSEAEAEWSAALASARALRTPEEEWKALYGLGRVRERAGDVTGAASLYRQAAGRIESLRSRLGAPALRADFFFDKRQVYDALLALTLRRNGSPEEVYGLLEAARARSLQDQAGAARGQPQPAAPALREIQGKLAAGTLLLMLWDSGQGSAVLWATSRAARLLARRVSDGDVRELLDRLEQPGADAWRAAAQRLSEELLAGIAALEDPGLRHVIVVPDGALAMLPFEVLPVAGKLLVERCSVSYLPAAGLLSAAPPGRRRPPWAIGLLALGDPAGRSPSGGLMPADEPWSRLPRSAEEVRDIAALLPGGAEVSTGAAARKGLLLGASGRDLPILHLGTHAAADPEDSARSRLLLAADSGGALDYVFLPEIQRLDLRRVELATLSSCETARGRLQLSEGVQSLGRAFLLAGAHATLTTLWRVADGPTADLMRQFYYRLGRGETKAAALREAKLKLLRSGALAHPHYWAAFVLSGDAATPVSRALPWTVVWLPAAILAAALAWWLRWRRRFRLRKMSAGEIACIT